MKRIFFVLSLITFLPISVISCSSSIKPIEGTIIDVFPTKNATFMVDINAIKFKEAGYNYGDTVNITIYNIYSDAVILSDVPFVSNFSSVGLFAPCICDYQKSGENLLINAGFTTESPVNIEHEFINRSIKFEICARQGYSTYFSIPLSKKMTFAYIDRDKYVYANARDIKLSSGLLYNENISKKKIFRLSSPFDYVNNSKRYEYSDSFFGDFMGSHPILINLDYDDFKYKDAKKTEIDFIQHFRENDNGAPNFHYFINHYDNSVFSIDIGDNFYSSIAKRSIKKVFDFIINYYKNLNNREELRVFLTDDEGDNRIGFICMLLESLAGAKYDDVVVDYMASYANYYNILPSSNDTKIKLQYQILKLHTIDRLIYALTLSEKEMLSIKWDTLSIDIETEILNKLEGKSLQSYAEDYFLSMGFSAEEINLLKNILKTA